MLALRADDVIDLLFHELSQYAEPNTNAERQQPFLRCPNQLAERFLDTLREHGLLHGRLSDRYGLLHGGSSFGLGRSAHHAPTRSGWAGGTAVTSKFYERRDNLLYTAWKKDGAVDVVDEEASEEEVTDATSLEDAEDEARSEILECLGTMPPLDFQRACAKLVAALGHHVAWISPPGPDGGIDFVAFADPIGATGQRIKGQAKATAEQAGSR
jgi:hypothetical protein